MKKCYMILPVEMRHPDLSIYKIGTEGQSSKTHFYTDRDTKENHTKITEVYVVLHYGISTTRRHLFGCLLSTVGFTTSNTRPLLL